MRTFVLLLLLVLPGYAAADITLTYTTPDGSVPFEVRVSGNKVRMDNSGAYGTSYTIIDLAAGTVHTVMPQHRMVTFMDGGSSGRMSELMAESEAARERMLSMLPPEYAQTMDVVLKGIKGIARMYADRVSPDVVSVEPTGETRSVGDVHCEVWETRADGELWTASCLARPEDLGVDRLDMDRMKAAIILSMALAKDITAQSDVAVQINVKMEDVEGIAVEMDQKKFDLGLWVLTGVYTEPVPAADFEIPSSYSVTRI